ncbi:hypothetical protein [Pyruvatibacter mobilis]|uniref:hypothetical protein n=1 Tax=Pyruvatibacter mobilis TaxID=1712261 RepID=UPI003BAF5271
MGDDILGRLLRQRRDPVGQGLEGCAGLCIVELLIDGIDRVTLGCEAGGYGIPDKVSGIGEDRCRLSHDGKTPCFGCCLRHGTATGAGEKYRIRA